MTERFHLLHTDIEKPGSLNDPFDYEPHPLCKLAVEEVLRDANLSDEGKMYGVLVAEDPKGNMGFLAAYSGQINGMEDDGYFVPAIFDYLQPDGYFKIHEARITKINHFIDGLEEDDRLKKAKKRLTQLQAQRDFAIEEHKRLMRHIGNIFDITGN